MSRVGVVWVFALAGLCQPVAAQSLSAEGAALPAATFAADEMAVYRIDAGADDVLSAHVILRGAGSNQPLARDRDGFWAPWDGDVAALPPAAAMREGEALVFKLFAASPPRLARPYLVTLLYRTPEGMKYGWFTAEIAPPDASGEGAP